MTRRRWILLLILIVGVSAIVGGCARWAEPPEVDVRTCLAGEIGLLAVRFFADVTLPAAWDGIAEIVMYEWDFGDGTIEKTPFGWYVVHQYDTAGPVEVRVSAIDSRGNRGVATLAMDVYEAAFVREWSLTLGFPVRVSGVVENRHDQTLDEVVVRGKFYDTAGVRFTQGDVTIFSLAPGEQAYFEVKADEYSPWIFHADVEIASFSTDCGLLPAGTGSL